MILSMSQTSPVPDKSQETLSNVGSQGAWGAGGPHISQGAGGNFKGPHALQGTGQATLFQPGSVIPQIQGGLVQWTELWT